MIDEEKAKAVGISNTSWEKGDVRHIFTFGFPIIDFGKAMIIYRRKASGTPVKFATLFSEEIFNWASPG